jgi:nucleotide-binding universal stress UspA family protein
MRTFQTILVPLDGSELSEQALPLAERLAEATGAELELVRVHQPPTAWATYSEAMAGLPVAMDDTAPAEVAYLAAQAAGVRAKGLEVSTSLLHGPVAPALARRARAVADLVVMTTHGRGPFNRFWLGSVADELLRSLEQPLLLVRPTMEPWAMSGGPPYRRILLPISWTETSNEAVEPAVALGSEDTEYVLVQILDTPIPATVQPIPIAVEPETLEAQREKAAGRLEAMAQGLRDRGLKVRTRVSVAGSATAGILAIAEEECPDLIVMATRGPGRLERMLLGSVTDQVVRAAHEPVLVVPAQG